VPAGSGLLGLDEDGTACSSDYYLRLTADGGRMLKGQLALTATRPTSPKPQGAQLDIFEKLLNNSEFFEEEPARLEKKGPEAVWQHFFESKL
jgi:hypothetical protein